MRASWTSLACMSLVLLLLAARGASDWSEGFAVLWYGLWAAAAGLAVTGVGIAVLKTGLRPRVRLITAGVAGVTLAASGFLVWLILDTLSHVS